MTSRRALAIVGVAALFAPACSPASTSPEAGAPTATTTGTGATTATGTATGTATTTASGTPTASGPTSGPHAGRWASPSCGARKYPRHLELGADGTFTAADLVSPCPPNVVCVWSGIINYSGKYTLEAGKITLTPGEGGGPQGQPLPTSLGIDPTTGAPFETDDGGKVCAYGPAPK